MRGGAAAGRGERGVWPVRASLPAPLHPAAPASCSANNEAPPARASDRGLGRTQPPPPGGEAWALGAGRAARPHPGAATPTQRGQDGAGGGNSRLLACPASPVCVTRGGGRIGQGSGAGAVRARQANGPRAALRRGPAPGRDHQADGASGRRRGQRAALRDPAGAGGAGRSRR